MDSDERPTKLRRLGVSLGGAEEALSEGGKACVAAYRKLSEDLEKLLEASQQEEANQQEDPVLERLRKVLAEGVTEVREKPSMDPDSIVRLNVGGDLRFAIRRGTLTCIPQSHLGRIFRYGWDVYLPRDASGRIFLDFDPTQFRLFMDWARKVEMLHLEEALPPFPVEPYKSDLARKEVEWLMVGFGGFLGVPWQRLDGCTVADLGYVNFARFKYGRLVCDDSLILNEGRLASLQLMEVFDEPCRLTLLYRASRDGPGPRAFHERCDGHSPTLTVAKSEGGSVFGCWTDAAWNSASDRKTGHVQLFQLARCNKKRLRRYGYTPSNGKVSAIQCRYDLGPGFGKHTRVIPSVQFLCSPEGVKAQLAGKYADPATGLAEGPSVQVLELEVFQVQQTGRLSGPAGLALQIRQQQSSLLRDPQFERVAEGLQALCDGMARMRSELDDTKLPDQPQCDANLPEEFLCFVAGRGPNRSDQPEIVSLNVRGHTMMTFKATLKMSEHFASKLGGRWQVQNDLDDGMLFIDQEPELFSIILRLLRAIGRGAPLPQFKFPPLLHHRRALFLEMCRYYLIDFPQSPRADSGILTARHEEVFQPIIEKLSSKEPKLLFRATRDGFSASKFHALCDQKGPTLVIVAHSHSEMLLGGLTEAEWSSSSTVKESKHAKLFQMLYVEDGKQLLLRTREVHQASAGITCEKDLGPCFGSKELRVVFDRPEGATVEVARTAAYTGSADEWDEFVASVQDIEVFAL